ncbi:hypothetical protein [Roseinatronobacter sp. S2]|nr:hypothetical protein [Roseinatronobacter sp. S2]WFE75358.1 hypothetical protein P8S53_02850 [Roseinatronobacter sp. S2]
MKYALLACVCVLCACGAEAPPSYSEPAQSGVTMSGEARIGVSTEL